MHFIVGSPLTTKIMSQNCPKIGHSEFGNTCYCYWNSRTRCSWQGEASGEVSFSLINLLGKLWAGPIYNIDNFPIFEPISVTQNQREQHSKSVQLPEVLWQYHVRRGFKQCYLANESHQDGCKWFTVGPDIPRVTFSSARNRYFSEQVCDEVFPESYTINMKIIAKRSIFV